MKRKILNFLKSFKFRLRLRSIRSSIKNLLFLFVGLYCGSILWKTKNQNDDKYFTSNLIENNKKQINQIHIGFLTDGHNIKKLDECLKTIFLHRQSTDYLSFHILAPKLYWSSIDKQFQPWLDLNNGLMYSFNYTIYDTEQCEHIIGIYQNYFDYVYNISFCKLIFPYLLDPILVPYFILMDMDIIILNHQFTTKCWLETIDKLNQHPFAIFSIAHQGSPLTKRLPFPMPYLQQDQAHFHFNIGIVIFHILRIHHLDKIEEEEEEEEEEEKSNNQSLSNIYSVPSGSHRWLRDFQKITLGYLQSYRMKHSLTQVLWNVYMAHRTDSFIQLNQACHFQPCAQHTYVQLWDDHIHFPNIILVHLWRVCLQQKTIQNNFFTSYYQALSYLPINYINRINPTKLTSNMNFDRSR